MWGCPRVRGAEMHQLEGVASHLQMELSKLLQEVGSGGLTAILCTPPS